MSRWKQIVAPALAGAVGFGLALAPAPAQVKVDGVKVVPSDQDRPNQVAPQLVKPKERTPFDVSRGVPLIPRDVLFGNPEKASGRVSPDGSMIAFLAPVDGVLNVFVGPASDLSKAKAVTRDALRGIRRYFWAYNSKQIVYTQDTGGDENWRVYATDVASGETRDLTPLPGVAARVMAVSEKFPDDILVGLNDRDPAWHDVYRVSLRSGQRTLVLKNQLKDDPKRGYGDFTVDDDFRIRFAHLPSPDGGTVVRKAVGEPKDGALEFADYDQIPFEDSDSVSIAGFDVTGNTAYLIDGRGRDTAALYTLDVETKAKKLVLFHPHSDIQGVMINPRTKALEAAQTNWDRETWNLLEGGMALAPDFFALRTQGGLGDMNVTSRSLDDRFWTVTFAEDDVPARTVLLDRGDLKNPKRKPKLTTLFVGQPALEGQPLVPMHAVIIPARDGLEMMSYLSLPLEADPDRDGKADRSSPTVLLVHGGPWARDAWGYNAQAQWLANRGYAVLQVNFRGSTGFGKKHLNAGNLEWAGKMHDDLLDAVDWAVQNGVAAKDKVAIMGGSYGGYATLVGLTFTPETFACGVDIVGPSNINTLLSTIPPYWQAGLDQMARRVGDFRTEDGKKLLETRSPLNLVDKIRRPLLIGQGANDPRVKQAEADQIVRAMKAKKLPVTYVLYPDEGHGFARPPNRKSFNAVTEAFLAQHLGGRVEPIGDAFKGSSIKVPEGAEHVPGLADALMSAAKGAGADIKAAPAAEKKTN